MPQIIPIILVAGSGSRLSPITKVLPKPLIPFPTDKPLIHSTLSVLYKHGCNHTILVVSSLGGDIAKYCVDQFKGKMQFVIINEKEPSGTFPPIEYTVTFLMSLISTKLLVVYGDVWVYPPVLSSFLEKCESSEKSIFMVSQIEDKSECTKRGIFCCDKDMNIAHFVEKPPRIPDFAQVFRSTGIFMLGPELINRIVMRGGAEKDFSKDFLEKLGPNSPYWKQCELFPIDERDVLDIGDIVTIKISKHLKGE